MLTSPEEKNLGNRNLSCPLQQGESSAGKTSEKALFLFVQSQGIIAGEVTKKGSNATEVTFVKHYDHKYPLNYERKPFVPT